MFNDAARALYIWPTLSVSQYTVCYCISRFIYCTSLFTICQLEHYIFSHFYQSQHSFYLITACYAVQFRRNYFSQQFTRVIIPNASTVCDRLYTVYWLPAGTLYTWPFSPMPTFFLFDNCLLNCFVNCLLYVAISA